MTRAQDFFDAFNIGFENLAQRANERVSYPPYNIVKTGESTYFIEIAVAGFGEDDIEVSLEESTLKVVGSISGVDEDAQYLHKGIASRPFTHTFTLAENVEVETVTMNNGMLTIRLRKIVPESKKFKVFRLNDTGEKEFLQD